MTRLASSGKGERAGGGLRPGVQTRHRSCKAKDVGQHFFSVGCVYGERTEGRSVKYAMLELSAKHGKRGG